MPDPVLLIVVPLGFSFLIPLFGLISRKIEKFIPPIVLLFNLILSLIFLPVVIRKPVVSSIGGFIHPFSINIYAGTLGVLFTVVISLIGFAVSLYAIGYIKEGATQKYHMLYLLLLTGATGVVLTADIFNLFVFYEILCISSYALVAYSGDKAGVESASKYLIQGSIGSTLMLIAIALIYGQFGTLNMASIAQNIKTSHPIHIYVPLILFITGVGVEAAIFPLNAWLPDAHSSAPSTISAVLSGIAIKMGIYVIIRIVYTIFGSTDILFLLVVVAVATLLIGEFSAFSQHNIKRMLAYSSTGQIGLILFALALGSSNGISAGIFQFINHALSKSLLFLSTGYMICRTGSMEISALEGMGKKMPVSSLAFTVGAFSLIGLPPFVGFPSKFLIVKAALSKGGFLPIVLIMIVLFGTVIEAVYFFKVIQVFYFKESKEPIERREAPPIAIIPLIILVIMILAVGLYPYIITGVLNNAASELLKRTVYIRGVLG
ncbi:MAG: hypothetical protein DRP54_02010 [Spirochaetes bacterium]|nr:MAG: hypothetical protein DRP54_02010 [Spirochaetota bacterium]